MWIHKQLQVLRRVNRASEGKLCDNDIYPGLMFAPKHRAVQREENELGTQLYGKFGVESHSQTYSTTNQPLLDVT